jgi:hypothetical protein
LRDDPNQPVYYGTKENKETGLPSHINNVMDAYEELEKLVTDPAFILVNDRLHHAPFVKLGDLHIYEERPMRYEPA